MSFFLMLGGFFFGVCVGLTAPDIYRKHFQRVIILRELPKEEAKELISEYVKNNEGIWTSDIIFDLELDVSLVLECLKELNEEDVIVPKEES